MVLLFKLINTIIIVVRMDVILSGHGLQDLNKKLSLSLIGLVY